MTKAQIHFSNDIDALIRVLKGTLFPEGASPFEKRLIAVPHMALKERILLAFAGDPEIRVAAGMQIVTLDQAYTLLTKHPLPSNLELSLFLQHELIGMIDKVDDLRSYFELSSKEERIGPFCDALATYFLRYKMYGKPELPLWQEELYQRLPWVFPIDSRGKVIPHLLHLFGFSHLPKEAFSFFQKTGATFYFFSPCAIFWGDFFSEKERAVIQKEMRSEQLTLFNEMSEDQNLLLANWGRVGRQLQLMVEDTEVPTREHYTSYDTNSALSNLQEAILEGSADRPTTDDSIEVISTTSRLRELEVLKDKLFDLFENKGIEPSDVQVFAPDINPYVSLIEAVFDDLDVTIDGVDFQQVDPLWAAFDQMIALPKNRFSVEDILQLLPHMKEEFDLGQVRKWIEASGIRWGFSGKQRLTHYMCDMRRSDICAVSNQGTWLEGFRRLILGLGHFEGEAIPIVGITEMESFDSLYTLLCDLADDLTPLFDGTMWTISTWIRYFACLLQSYFPIDPSHDLYRQLIQLASQTDRLDKKEVSFEEIRRVINRRKTKSLVAPHLQAIRFSSLSEGCLVPSKVVAFLGLEEGEFPRREVKGSLYFGELNPRPIQNDIDRYLFLQGLLFAKDYFYVSYVRDLEGKLGTSLLIEQLLAEIEGASVLDHPASAVDPRYYGGDLLSYDPHAYALLKAGRDTKLTSPLLPSLYAPAILEKTDLSDISLKSLAKFARHPLRYHLHEVLGIYPEFRSKDQREYLLDPMLRSRLVKKQLLGQPIEDSLPPNLFKPLALSQIDQEVELWREAIGNASFEPQTISLDVGPYLLSGTIDTATSCGWFFRAKDTLEDRIRFFPQLLLADTLGIPVTFILDGSKPKGFGSVEGYLDYFAYAQSNPSPLMPQLAKAFLASDPEQLRKGFKQLEDEVWSYLYLRDPLPRAEVMLETWGPTIQEVFGGVYAEV